MIDIRPFSSLGHADHGWLNAKHHFSFARYHDPDRMGWGAIRVWNDDLIEPKRGFAPHSHDNMEIITFVRSGAISHKDSLGNEGRTVAGDVQVMSAGSGITHSEYNHEDTATTLFQIWVTPDEQGKEPSWGTRQFPQGERAEGWEILASSDPEGDNALPIRADARVMGATLKKGEVARYSADPARHQYLVAQTGSIKINGQAAQARDGVAITDEATIEIEALEDAELVMVDAK